MKVEIEKEILYEKLNKNKPSECPEHISFKEYLENNILEELKELERKRESDELKSTSIFVEKKTGRRTTDIFDTLIDI